MDMDPLITYIDESTFSLIDLSILSAFWTKDEKYTD